MNVYWRPHHAVQPELRPEQDFLAFGDTGGKSIGQVYLMEHGDQLGRWRWSMYAHSTTGRVPFETYGYADNQREAERRVAEAYQLLVETNERHPHVRRDSS
jgi:hypothetical protein